MAKSPSSVVERETIFPHPPEKVWRTLTEKSKLSLWLHPATDDIKPVVGHRFVFEPAGGKGSDRIDCRVLSVDAGRQLSYSWQPANGEPASTVMWTLEPIDGGTRVYLRHDGSLPGSTIPQLSAALSSPASHHSIRLFRGRRQFQGALLCR